MSSRDPDLWRTVLETRFSVGAAMLRAAPDHCSGLAGTVQAPRWVQIVAWAAVSTPFFASRPLAELAKLVEADEELMRAVVCGRDCGAGPLELLLMISEWSPK